MKLYVKNVTSCGECPACMMCTDRWYCVIADKMTKIDYTKDEEMKSLNKNVMPWCPLEDVEE